MQLRSSPLPLGLVIALARAHITEISIDPFVPKDTSCTLANWFLSPVAHKENEKGTYHVGVQYSDVRRRHEQILEERSNHMPRLELE